MKRVPHPQDKLVADDSLGMIVRVEALNVGHGIAGRVCDVDMAKPWRFYPNTGSYSSDREMGS